MTGIARYILRQLTVGMIFVSAALVAVLWLSQSLRLIEMIVSKGLSALTFLHMTLLLMPSFLVIILPIALFAVVMFTYNKLTADRELVVMRAAGLSNGALARPALILALLIMVLSYALTLWGIPVTVQKFREMQWSLKNEVTGILLQEGSFNRFGDGLTIYVRSRSNDGELLGLLVHDKRNAEKPVTLMAEKGALVYTENGPRVLLINGNRQQLPRGTGQLSTLYFDSYTVELAQATGSGNDRFRDARELSLAELLAAKQAVMGQVDYRRAKVELHQRLTSPLFSLGFALIALVALLRSDFDRRGQTMPILKGIGVMLAVQAAGLGSINLATSNLSLTPLIYVVAAMPVFLGGWLLLFTKSAYRSHRSATA